MNTEIPIPTRRYYHTLDHIDATRRTYIEQTEEIAQEAHTI